MRVSKEVIRHIEAELVNYHETQKELERLVALSPESIRSPYVFHLKKIDYLTALTTAIATVYERLPEYKKELVRLKYWVPVQTLTWDGIAQKCYVSRRQAFKYRDEFITSIAHHLGW